MKELTCERCGKKFSTKAWNTVFCADCRHERYLENKRKYRAKNRERILAYYRAYKKGHRVKADGPIPDPPAPKPEPKKQTVASIVLAAREAHMSYGQYVAQMDSLG